MMTKTVATIYGELTIHQALHQAFSVNDLTSCAQCFNVLGLFHPTDEESGFGGIK